MSKTQKKRYGKCQYCHCVGILTRDHIIPRAAYSKASLKKYGVDLEAAKALVIDPANYAKSCASCNLEKADHSPVHWISIMPEAGVPFVKKYLQRVGVPHTIISRNINARNKMPASIRFRREPNTLN